MFDKIITYLNTRMQGDQQQALTSFLVSLYNHSKEHRNSFSYAIRYKERGVILTQKRRRNIISILVDSGDLKVHKGIILDKDNKIKQYKNNGVKEGQHARYENIYSISEGFLKAIEEYVEGLIKTYNCIRLTANTSILEMKTFIKRIYNKTEFTVETINNTTKHKFRLKGIMYVICSSRQGPYITEVNGLRKTIYSFIEFNNLIMRGQQKI